MITTPTATGSASGWPPMCSSRSAEADDREHDLRQHDERDVHDDRRTRHRAADAGPRQQARLDDVAADLEHRQQPVDRLADPARPEHRPHGRPQLAGQQAPPADRVAQHRQQVERRHQRADPKPAVRSAAATSLAPCAASSAVNSASPTTSPG